MYSLLLCFVQPLLLLQQLMRRLDCVVQKYAWGKRGGSSKVAQLKQCESSDYEVSMSYNNTRFVEVLASCRSYGCCSAMSQVLSEQLSLDS
jgi:Phosphomannose isomerase type I